MNRTLKQLESQGIHILREAYSSFKSLCMLWSIGKDSTVLLWLARKAFAGHVPFPLVHIDTSFKIPEMIAYRDRLAKEWNLDLRYAMNHDALSKQETFPHGRADRLTCCRLLKTVPLRDMLAGTCTRYRFNHDTGCYEAEQDPRPFTAAIVGVRADEEGTRSKERFFSPRSEQNFWDIAGQPPEFWQQFNTDFPPNTHVRIHPLLEWTEVNIWEYIEAQKVPTVSLYYDQGSGKRYRSLGCAPCTCPIDSQARTPAEVRAELAEGKLASVPERSGRAQDKEDGGGLEKLRRNGYM